MWSKPANQLRVFYRNDGSTNGAFTNVSTSTDLRERARDVLCQKNTEFCPRFEGGDSSACVFKLKKSTSIVNSKTTTVSIERTLRGEVEKQAGPLTAKGSAEVKSWTFPILYQGEAKIVSYESRQFLVIPPGCSFCASTNNTSVPDVHAATGFRWRCSFPEYILAQERFDNGRCKSSVCGRTQEASGGGSVCIRSRFAILVFCLTVVFRVY